LQRRQPLDHQNAITLPKRKKEKKKERGTPSKPQVTKRGTNIFEKNTNAADELVFGAAVEIQVDTLALVVEFFQRPLEVSTMFRAHEQTSTIKTEIKTWSTYSGIGFCSKNLALSTEKNSSVRYKTKQQSDLRSYFFKHNQTLNNARSSSLYTAILPSVLPLSMSSSSRPNETEKPKQ
jgi:hypothetical protein